ncbi:sulfatase-like hydrolase/transferase [Ruminococcaceae bacterium OttesenSCG-928-L11]|nr:sulfatase-like hydrolase/transferase [Ruminococcaceae bacterium OttesenSCG-928-L11]
MKKKQPNLLFIMPDEFRQMSMGFLGQDPTLTPCINRLAEESLCLPNAVSSYPVCSPYRASLFTGQYPWRNGVVGNCNTSTAQFGVYLSPGKTTLTDVLADGGYECGYVGKYHLDTPEPKDFDYIESRRGDGKVWDAFTPPHRRHKINFWYSYGCNDKHFKPHYWHNDDKVEDVREVEEWAPAHEADVVMRYLKNEDDRLRDSDKPFALFWSPNPPHMPFDQVPDSYKALYADRTPEELLTRPNALREPAPEIPENQRAERDAFRETATRHVANYFAAVSGIDEQVGKILDTLEHCGLAEDTIVIFTSDHGDMMGSHSLMYKGLWYDECFKVPFLIRWPGRIVPGKKDFFLNPADIMPTLLGLTGLECPTGVEGQNLAAGLTADWTPARDEGYYINPAVNARGVQDHRYYFVVVRDHHDEELTILYDREADPFQQENIAASHPEVVAAMRGRLEEWLLRTDDVWVRK